MFSIHVVFTVDRAQITNNDRALIGETALYMQWWIRGEGGGGKGGANAPHFGGE